MGQEKAGLLLGRETLVQRVVRHVQQVTTPVIVSCRQGQSLPELHNDIAIVQDSLDDAGPLAGIAAGLAALQQHCAAVLIVACDHPLVTTDFLRRLITSLGEAPAVIPHFENRDYPLLAVYRVELATIAADQLARGHHRVLDFVTRTGAVKIEAETLFESDRERLSMLNLNDPQAYQQALRVIESE